MKPSKILYLALGLILILLSILPVGCPGWEYNQVDKARRTATKACIVSLTTALERYEMENGCFPTTEQGLKALMKKPTIAPIPQGWNGPYLSQEQEPVDAWGHPYHYRCPPTHNKIIGFDIWSSGPDGKDGTDDDITNWKEDKPTVKPIRTSDIVLYLIIGAIVMGAITWITIFLARTKRPK